MTKELEAFEEIKKYLVNLKFHFLEEELSIVETALEEKENIEKTVNELFSENGKVITTIEIKKKLKALEIIKKKNVNVRAFKKVLLMKQNDDVKLRSYNSQNHTDEDDLTQEEFELLKEVLL